MPASFIRFRCPACDGLVSAAPQYAHPPGPCPLCRAEIVVPSASPPPARTLLLTLPPGSWPPAAQPAATASIGHPPPRRTD